MPEINEVERDGFRRMSGEDQEMFREPRAYDVSLLWLLAAGRRWSDQCSVYLSVFLAGATCVNLRWIEPPQLAADRVKR